MRSKSTRIKRRRQNKNHNYGTLEARNMLATLIDVNQATGELSVRLTADNDSAVIAIDQNDNVTVNGAQDLDTDQQGIQTLPASQLESLEIDGDGNLSGQIVVFNDTFHGNTSVGSVDITDVNQVTINGRLTVRGDLNVEMTGSGGRIGDAETGRLTVGGETTIDAGSNTIGLNNTLNDFNELNVTTEGNELNAVISDISDVMLTGVKVSGEFILNAQGDIEDAQNTFIEVLQDARIKGDSITIGDQPGDSTNFFRASFDAERHVEVQEDSNINLVDARARTMTLRTVGGIYDGLRSNINVNGLAQFFGNNRVRLGEGGLDSFNAGSVEFRSNGHVTISENSDTHIVGSNNARSLTLTSWGHITDEVDAKITVDHETGFTGVSVVLGDTDTDRFNTGSMYFWTTEMFSVSEDSSSHIIETKNQAGDFELEANGAITDANNARMNVTNLAKFKANTVNVGDTNEDWFNAGTVSFESAGLFKISENSDLQLAGDNRAFRTVLNSSDNITNVADAKVNVTGSAAFFGDNIVIGNRTGDEFNAGTIAFRTAQDANGLVHITEDSATNVGGVNEAMTLKLASAGSITDGPRSQVKVMGNAELTTENNGHIVVGDSGMLRDGTTFDAAFESRTLTVQTDGSGNALIEEDGDIILKGVNKANSLSLVAKESGKILDTVETELDVRYNLNVEGSLVNLGTAIIPNGSSTDKLEFSTLTFKTTGNINVSADDSFFLVGDSETGGFLTLESEGDIRSTSGSELLTETGARFDGMDILVGNLDDDCFDILQTDEEGKKRLTVNGEGTSDVQLGCSQSQSQT